MKKVIAINIFCIITLICGIAQAELTDGLKAYYPFNGNANDVWNSHNAEVYGATLTTDRYGAVDNAYSFDGLNDYMVIPYHPDIEPSVFSISFWIKTSIGTGNPTFDAGAIINSNLSQSSCDHGYSLYVRDSGTISYKIDDTPDCGGGIMILSDQIVNDNQWHHVVAIYDSANNLHLYIDGMLQSATANLPYSKTNEPIYIGKVRSDTPEYQTFFMGQLDELRIYDRVLSLEEILQLTNVSPVSNCGEDRVVFDEVTPDGSGSYDPDPSGSIVSYYWKLTPNADPDNYIEANGVNPTISGLTNGFYNMCLTVTDNNGATGIDCCLLAAAGSCFCTPNTIHVESIIPSTAAGTKGSKFGQVNVIVQDDCGNPASGVDVTGTFSGDYLDSLTGTTGSDGSVIFTTSTETKRPTYEFCVDLLSHGSLTYVSSDNVEMCDGISR